MCAVMNAHGVVVVVVVAPAAPAGQALQGRPARRHLALEGPAPQVALPAAVQALPVLEPREQEVAALLLAAAQLRRGRPALARARRRRPAVADWTSGDDLARRPGTRAR